MKKVTERILDPEPFLRTHPDLGFMGRFKRDFSESNHAAYQMEFKPRLGYEQEEYKYL